LMWARGLIAIALISCAKKTVSLGAGGRVEGHVDEVDAVVRAVSAADEVYGDERFWKLVKRRSWISSARPTNALGGDEVAARLSSVRPIGQRYRLRHIGAGWLPFVSGGTTASTASCVLDEQRPMQCGVITVNEDKLDRASYLVNTVAHEVTHVVGAGVSETVCRCDKELEGPIFTDTPEHPDELEVWMVSYTIGDLAQCFRDEQGDERKTEDCLYHHINGNEAERVTIECCKKSPLPKDVLNALRSSTGRCNFECPGTP
jgi:hypothetical protein